MPAHSTLCLLYLGRHATLLQEIETEWQQLRRTELASTPFTLQHFSVHSQSQALDALRAHPLHALLIDADNQRQGRKRFCQELRRRYPELLIAAVSIEPLKAGHFAFDQTIRLPLRPEDAQHFLHQLFRKGAETELRVGRIHLNVATRTVLGPRGSHRLPPKQCALLRILMQSGEEIVSRETIMRTVWETEYLADTRTLDVHIRWLREKIEPNPSRPVHLLTVRGKGFRLAAG